MELEENLKKIWINYLNNKMFSFDYTDILEKKN